ncbi:NAD-binding protein [Atractiella rhizophila]|nr:NAD-binding protein [Atractiella rhizophila]
MIDLGLDHAVVLVTGASGGIGQATVRAFHEQGSRVYAHYNSSPPASSAQPFPEGVSSVQANVLDESAVEKMFESIGEGVDVLVVNHGIALPEDVPIHEMSTEQWDRTMGINLRGTFFLIRAFFRSIAQRQPQDKTQSPCVVLIGSTSGKFGEAGHADYSSSKAAMMHGLLPTLKNEIVKLAPRGRVNCVAPGWVATPMAAHLLNDARVLERAVATTPLKKIATPEDVALQILLLASEKVSGHVSGECVFVSGGMEGRLLNPLSFIP